MKVWNYYLAMFIFQTSEKNVFINFSSQYGMYIERIILQDLKKYLVFSYIHVKNLR